MATTRGHRAVIYVRESLDRWGDERAVEQFEAQCRQLCDARGLDVLRVLRDNDVRASNGNKGDGYAEVLGQPSTTARAQLRWSSQWWTGSSAACGTWRT